MRQLALRDHAANDDWADLSGAASLIPMIGHDEPARASIGSKNLKQALPLVDPEPPLVRTGAESVIARAGVVRVPASGHVTDVADQHVEIQTSNGTVVVSTGHAPADSGVDSSWVTVADRGDPVFEGDVLSHAPDVVVEVGEDGDETPVLSLGVNAMVGLLSWKGWNFEDGVVVSRSLARRMSSRHLRRHRMVLSPDDLVIPLVDAGQRVDRGDPLLVVRGGDRTTMCARVSGIVSLVAVDEQRAEIGVVTHEELQVGDKVTNRHGGKGVITLIEEDESMPRLPDGTRLDALLNPIGVLRRLNTGQALEMAVGMNARLAGIDQVTVGRRVDTAELAASLAALGMPGGRARLRDDEGRHIGPDAGVMVGPQYLLKLNHLARAKAKAVGATTPSPRTLQPTRPADRDHRDDGRAQRMGEMEIWGLQAAGAVELLTDLFQVRGRASGPAVSDAPAVAPTLQVVAAHLAVASIRLVVWKGDGTRTTDLLGVDPTEPLALTVEWGEVAGLQALTPNELEQIATDRVSSSRGSAGRSLTTGTHPLYRHPAGAPVNQVARTITLPWPVVHPWFPPDSGRHVQHVPVLPPSMRAFGVDDLDRAYRRLARALVVSRRPTAPGDPRARTRIEQAVVELLGEIDPNGSATFPRSIAGRLSGKRGLLRRSMLGRAAEFSARAVIVASPDRDPETVGVPEWVWDRIAPLGTRLDGDSDVVVLNRQPTLLPYTLVGLRAEPVSGDALRIHPIILGALAGDFDGDTVAIHRPASPAARAEAWSRLRPGRALRSAANGAVLAKHDLDVAVGLRVRTATREGRDDLERELGIPVQGHLDAAGISALADSLATSQGLDGLRRLFGAGLVGAMHWGWSILDLVTDDVERLEPAVHSGAVSPRVVDQLLSRRGEVCGPNASLAGPSMVEGSYLSGLNPDEYWRTAAESVGGLAQKKLLTPSGGALTKRLVELAYEVTIGGRDCGSVADARGPLTCLDPQPCQRCYGPDLSTGATVERGARVGLLAAMVVGERSTQLAMKGFQVQHQEARVSSGLNELNGILGSGEFTMDGRRVRLSDLCDPAVPGALNGVVDVFTQVMQASVAPRHAEVLMRLLCDHRDAPGRGGLDQRARRAVLGAVSRATAYGDLRPIVDEVTRGGHPKVSLRDQILAGGVAHG